MRLPPALGSSILISSIVLASSWAPPARADEPRAREPDPGPALVAGAAVLLAGFAVGSTLASTAGGDNGATNAGWLLMQSSMALAPMTANLVEGTWVRGLAYSAIPAGTLGGTVALFSYDPGTVLHGSLEEQRVMWGLFGLGLVGSLVGIASVTWGPSNAVHVAPTVARDGAGLAIGGAL